MPTGYTAVVDDGGSFSDYVWSCARAFFREGEFPGKVEVSKHYYEWLARDEAKLRELETCDKAAAYESWLTKENKYRAEQLAKNRLEIKRYQEMRQQVLAWATPKQFKGLKDLMLKQLDVGWPSDMSEYYQPVERTAPLTWWSDQLKLAREDVKRSREDLARAEKFAADADAFLAGLKKLVPRR